MTEVSRPPKVSVFNVPNILTMFRVVLIPVLVIVFYLPFQWSYLVAALIFAVAAITDWFDGYLARRLKQSTKLGAFLDPVADKLIVAVALILLVQVYASPLLSIPAIVIVCREITISALREWMAELGKRASVAVSYVGKVKTVVQMVAMIALLASRPDLTDPVVILAFVLLYAATALTLWSMWMYMRVAWPELIAAD